MSKPMHKRMLGPNYREHELHLERATDAAGYWFATAMVLGFLAAGLIVYRSDNLESRPAVIKGAPVALATSGPAPSPPRQH